MTEKSIAEPKFEIPKSVWVGFFVVSLIIGVFFWIKGISFETIWTAMKGFSFPVLCIAGCGVLAQAAAMVSRIWVLLPSPRVPFLTVASAITYGQLMNVIFPARAGDVLKAVVISRVPAGGEQKVSLLTGAGVIIADKLLDMSSLVALILLFGVYALPQAQKVWQQPVWVYAAVILAVVAVAFFARAKLSGMRTKLNQSVRNFFSGLGSIGDLPRVGTGLLIGLIAWGGEGFALKTLCASQGFPLEWAQVFYLLCLLNLAIAVPVTLANVGPFEAALAFGMNQFGIDVPVAIGIATVHHAVQILGVLLAAGIVFVAKLIAPKDDTNISSEFRVRTQDKDKAIAYFESVSGNYDETVSKSGLSYFRNKERGVVLSLSKMDKPGLTFIDVGCGAGFYALAAKEKGLKVWAVDAAPGMVDRLRGKVDEVAVADIESYVPGRTFDRVICAGVMDFVLRREQAFNALCKMVGPTGRLVILCPRRGPGGLFYRIEKFFFGMRINVYTLQWYKKMAEAQGLKVVEFVKPLPTNMAIAFDRV